MLLRDILADARETVLFPRDFYRAGADAGWGRPAAGLVLWGLAAALVDAALTRLSGGRAAGDLVVDLLAVVFFPLLALVCAAFTTLVLHALWRLLGGKGGLKGTWRAAGSVAPAMPLIALTEPLGLFGALPWLWVYGLLALAGEGVHGLSRRKAWGAAFLLAVLHVAAVAVR
ncbi:MAG: YIP1 family protein [Elusimicrobia bacterium]|nr:YIP1 family protein [Elusimicrobiota bacterium]